MLKNEDQDNGNKPKDYIEADIVREKVKCPYSNIFAPVRTPILNDKSPVIYYPPIQYTNTNNIERYLKSLNAFLTERFIAEYKYTQFAFSKQGI